MRKTITIISNKFKETDQEQFSIRGYDLVFSNSANIIDLPQQLSQALINNDMIVFKAISWCMFPVIWAGDILKVKPIKPEDARLGDIVFYKSAGRAYSHRLIRIYKQKDRLYMITGGEREYRNNKFSDRAGIPIDNILGKIIKVVRGSLCFSPNEVKLNLRNSIKGRLKLSIWTLVHKIKQNVAKIFIKLQGFKLYRYFFKILIKDKLALIVGTSLMKNKREINNFCFYRRFIDFSKVFASEKGLYIISAKIKNWPVGNISLFFDTDSPNRKACVLSNFIVRIPFRGGGIGRQLLENALYLCNKSNIAVVKVNLSREDKIAYKLFSKLGFEEFK